MAWEPQPGQNSAPWEEMVETVESQDGQWDASMISGETLGFCPWTGANKQIFQLIYHHQGIVHHTNGSFPKVGIYVRREGWLSLM